MARLTTVFSILISAVLATTTVRAQGVTSDSNLERSGLASIWFTSAGLGSGGKIVDWAFDVNWERKTSFIILKAGKYRECISETELDGFNQPLGLDGLVEKAEFRKEILQAELNNRGDTDLQVESKQYSLPKSTIFILGDNSQVTSIDADSGKQNWSTSFGSLGNPVVGVHGDDQYVAAVNSSAVFCFDAVTGKQLWSHHCKYPVAAPPVVAHGSIYIPLMDGRLEIFEISLNGFGSYAIVATGIATARPLVTEKTVAWPTHLGYLNFSGVSGKHAKRLVYRLKADGPIDGTPTRKDDMVFTASADGFVYAVQESTGKLVWQTSLGSAMSQSPFVFGDKVYAVTQDRKMFCLDALTGDFAWDAPKLGFGRYLGASESRVYITDGFRNLLVVDPASGTVLSQCAIGEVDFVLPNRLTDRLYVGSKSGIVQCIHEIGSEMPYFHPEKIIAQAARKSRPAPAASDDPFADAPGDADDPFKSNQSDDDDPFKSGDPDPDDDPFK